MHSGDVLYCPFAAIMKKNALDYLQNGLLHLIAICVKLCIME